MRLMIAWLALLGCGGSQRPQPEPPMQSPRLPERLCPGPQCATLPPIKAEDCGLGMPRGTQAQLKTAVRAASGPSIDPPLTCVDDDGTLGTYIRVYGPGTRPIEMGEAAFTRCKEWPSSTYRCAFSDSIGAAVARRLYQRGVDDSGFGLGACGDLDLDYDHWNFSIIIHDWRDADAAIAAVDRELRARNVGHFFGVSLTQPPCATPGPAK